MMGAPGVDADGSLARGLTKLARSLGIADKGAVDVRLADEVAPELLDQLRSAARDRRRVAIDYYSFAHDEHTEREIDPYQVFADHGRWYVAAWCHRAEGERVFRLDRVGAAEVLEVPLRPAGGGRPRRHLPTGSRCPLTSCSTSSPRPAGWPSTTRTRRSRTSATAACASPAR